MTTIFFATWLAQSLNNWRVFNESSWSTTKPISWGSYLVNPDFWERTLQNWQSEFLAVGTMAVFTIYLRQRGSPESKPVGAPARRDRVVGLKNQGQSLGHVPKRRQRSTVHPRGAPRLLLPPRASARRRRARPRAS